MHASLSLLTITIATCLVPRAVAVVVHTPMGAVRGVSTGAGQAFMGIPYAIPPLGERRWQPPAPHPGWPRPLDATTTPPACPQVHCTDITPKFACPTKTSEDCLTLDIYTPPSTTNASSLPVMFFIHGGNFFYGDAASPLYNGSNIAHTGNVVVVNINYRIGALGFLVTGLHDNDARGNYALLDQRLALLWVHGNIRAFGGDPGKVTMFGQSAGAQSTLHHMTSKASHSYFRSAILESTPASLPYKTFEEAFVLGGLFAEALGCPVADLPCMRAKSSNAVAEAAFKTRKSIASPKYLEIFEPWAPSIDGEEVVGQPLDVFTSSPLPRKPMIIGSLSEETVLFIYSAFAKPVALAEYVGLITGLRPSKVTELLQKYPPILNNADQREALVTTSVDLIFTCPTRHIARTNRNATAQTWVYLWDHPIEGKGVWGNDTYCEGRVCHGSELPYVFDTAYMANLSFSPLGQALSGAILQYWVNFAWCGNPDVYQQAGECPKQHEEGSAIPKYNTGTHYTDASTLQMRFKSLTEDHASSRAPLPSWPRYGPAANWTINDFTSPGIQLVPQFREEYCDFWDSIGYY